MKIPSEKNIRKKKKSPCFYEYLLRFSSFKSSLLFVYELLSGLNSGAWTYSTDFSYRLKWYLNSMRTFLRSRPDQWGCCRREGRTYFLTSQPVTVNIRDAHTEEEKCIPEFPSSDKYFLHVPEPRIGRFRANKSLIIPQIALIILKCHFLEKKINHLCLT